jgi:ornithine cyclodeaminase
MPFELSILNGRTVFDLVHGQPNECVRVVRDAYLAHARAQTVNPQSQFVRFPSKPDCRMISLPAYLGKGFDVAGVKWIASFPANVTRGWPRASGVLVLSECETGHPFAVVEGSVISAARTAASAALAAHWLSGQSRRARALGIVGTGLIARSVYDFLLDTGWELDEVWLYDRAPLASERFQTRVCRRERHRLVVVARDAPALVRACDLIVFATVASAPHVTDATLLDHDPLVLHLSLRDLAPALILRSNNVVDDVEHVMRAGTALELAEKEAGHRRFVTGTLGEVMLGRRGLDPRRPTIFSPFGLGILDVALGKWVFEQAVARGQGLRLTDFFLEAAA